LRKFASSGLDPVCLLVSFRFQDAVSGIETGKVQFDSGIVNPGKEMYNMMYIKKVIQ